MLSVKNTPLSLTGRGVFVAVIDTGIDIFHSDFINENGDTKIYELWDQTISGIPPRPFINGTLYTRKEINAAIHSENGRQMFQSRDDLGHGTHVASICAGRTDRCEIRRYKQTRISKDDTVDDSTAVCDRYSDKGKQTSGSEYQLWA